MIYLLGGSIGFDHDLKASFLENIVKTNEITFVPTSPDDVEMSLKYLHTTLDWFKEIGIEFENYSLIKTTDTVDEAKIIIDRSDVVYLMGGNPYPQMALIKKLNLDTSLRNYKGIIIGNSAGALNSCKFALISRDEDFSENHAYMGMNIASEISVDVHYNASKDADVFDLMKRCKLDEIYAIPENSAILIDEGKLHFIEDEPIYLFIGHQKIRI